MKLKTNSLARGEATNNIASIIVTMKNKMVRDKSRWVIVCLISQIY